MAPPRGYKRAFIISFLYCLIHNTCFAIVTTDIEITYFVVDGLLDKLPLDQEVPVLPTVNFKNNGPGVVTAITGSQRRNLGIKVYLSDIGNPGTATPTFWREMGHAPLSAFMINLFQSEILVGHTLGGTDVDATMKIPSENCELVEYLCLELLFIDPSQYVDSNMNNNIKCAKYGPRSQGYIGEIECYIDIQTIRATVLGPTSLTHLPGAPSTLTIEAEIKNNGYHSVPTPSTGQYNFAPQLYLTDGATLASSTFNILQNDNNVKFDNTLVPNETLTLPSFTGEVIVPLDSDLCQRVTHLCVEITLLRDEFEVRGYGDEEVCLELKSVTDGGAGIKLGCPTNGTDIAMVSFVVRNPTSLLYDIAVPTTITMDTSLTNLGSGSIPASDSHDNYEFQFFVSDHLSDMTAMSDSVPFTVVTSSATNLRKELIFGFPIDISSLVATVTLPASTSRCEAFESVCLKVMPRNGLPYTDINLSNNYICLPFDDSGAGNKTCPELDVDIVATNLVVTPSSGALPVDVRSPTSLTFVITNNGPGSIPAATDPAKNFELDAFLTNNGNLENATIRIPLADFRLAVDQSKQSLGNGATVPFTISPTDVILPAEYCDVITHLCIKLNIDDSSLYTDTVPDSSDTCADIQHYIDCFTDIAAENFVVKPSGPVTYDPGFSKTNLVELTAANNGGIMVEDVNDYNFKPKIFLTNSADFDSASFKIRQQEISTQFDQQIVGKASVTLPEFPIYVKIPTNKNECQAISHLCILLDHNVARYNDTNSTNDFTCLAFGAVNDGKAGTFTCDVSLDLSTDDLTFSPNDDDGIYQFDDPTSIDVTLDVTNQGPGNIADVTGSNINYDIAVFLTDSDNLEDATTKMEQPNIDISITQLQRQLRNGNGLTFSFSTDITIPYVNCSSITHVCFIVTLHNDDVRVYDDVTADNNDVCLRFGPKEEGKAGLFQCYIDIAAIKLLVMAPQPLNYDLGQNTDLTVQLSVTNYGGIHLQTAPPGIHNFGIKVYLTGSDQLYDAVIKREQYGVNKLFHHEVGSHFIVTLPVFDINITISTDIDCKNFRYLCILVIHNEERYTDYDRSNDYVCIRFGPVVDGMAGELPFECGGNSGNTEAPPTTIHRTTKGRQVTVKPVVQTTDQSSTDYGIGSGLGKLRVDRLPLHYAMIITTLVFVAAVVTGIVIIKWRKTRSICIRI